MFRIVDRTVDDTLTWIGFLSR